MNTLARQPHIIAMLLKPIPDYERDRICGALDIFREIIVSGNILHRAKRKDRKAIKSKRDKPQKPVEKNYSGELRKA